jgi:glutaredoxin-related protein
VTFVRIVDVSHCGFSSKTVPVISLHHALHANVHRSDVMNAFQSLRANRDDHRRIDEGNTIPKASPINAG